MEKIILAKCGRKKAKCGRKQAAFGSEMAAAGVMAGATLAAAKIGADSAKEAANNQANATIASAQKQAQAIKDQTVKSREYQIQSQEFIKEQNAESRDMQRDIQMQLQILTGQQNVNNRFEASKIVAKNGTSVNTKHFLRGNNNKFNLPFKVTDGGYAVPVLRTPEGFDMFELKGNDHEHYHKTPWGKYKTGVGIKFKDNTVVEGQGDQNTGQGEYLLHTPWSDYFISKNNIAGLFNPVKAVNGGMHPLKAFNLQEYIKSIFNISDDGSRNGFKNNKLLAKSNSSPVGKRMAFAGTIVPDTYTMYNQNNPKFETDTVGDTAVGVAYTSKDKEQMKCGGKKRTLKCGGKVRQKAYNGYENWFKNPAYNTLPDITIVNPDTGTTINWGTGKITLPSDTIVTSNVSKPNNNISTPKSSSGFWNDIAKNYAAPFISTLANVGGAWLTSKANKYTSNKLAEAYNISGNLMADAYNSLQGIDLSTIKEKDFNAAHAMPALQAPIDRSANQIAKADRQLQRSLSNAGKYNPSGAASQDRMTKAEVDYQDIKNNIYSLSAEQKQKILNENANRITQAAIQNAQLDMEAKNKYISAYWDAIKYNADTDKEKTLGAAGALSEASINAAGAIANARTANGNSWNTAILNSGMGFANTLSDMAARKADISMALLGSSGDSKANYYANSASYSDAKNYYNGLVKQYDAIKNSNDPEDKDYKARLKRFINILATSRNFDTV